MTGLPEAPPLYLVDHGSTDGTAAAVAERFPEVALFLPGRNLGGAGRNLAVAAVEAPYVAFCDDDTSWSPGSLAQGVSLLERHPRVAVLTARIIVEPAETEGPICQDLATSPFPGCPETPGPRLVSFLAGAPLIRRDAFAGGFDPRLFIGGEEELLAADLLDAGWHLAYAEQLEVHHRASALRDAHLRRHQGIRNTLWFTWLRRPLPVALRRTAALAARLPATR